MTCLSCGATAAGNSNYCLRCGPPRQGKPSTRYRDTSAEPGSNQSSTQVDGQRSTTCFALGTRVFTPSGLRAIETLVRGDTVWSVNEHCVLEPKAVLHLVKHPPEQILSIEVSGPFIIRTTPNHSFFRDGRWVRAGQLRPGDAIDGVTENGRSFSYVIQAATMTTETSPVFNLIVDDNFSFVAESVFAHSFTRLRAVRMALWRWRIGAKKFVRSELLPVPLTRT